MTLLSRVLGLIRDVVIANIIGAGAAADVFLFANRIPNFLRRLFAEGAFSQAFVPVLAEYQKSGDITKTQEFIGKVSGTLGGLVTAVTALAMIGSPVVAAIFGTGWFVDWLNDGPNAIKFEQASLLLKITFPYLWFITFVALSGAILNTIGKFGVMSFSPVLLNIAMILTALLLAPHLESPDLALAIPFSYVGLAIASAMSATLNAYLLYRGLVKSDVYRFSKESAIFFLKILGAAALMGLLVWHNSPHLLEWSAMSFSGRVYWLIWLIGLAVISYVGMLIVLGVRKQHLLAR